MKILNGNSFVAEQYYPQTLLFILKRCFDKIINANKTSYYQILKHLENYNFMTVFLVNGSLISKVLKEKNIFIST